MKDIVEKSCGRVFKAALRVFNSFKKRVTKTECRVHKFINHQSIIILKNDGYYNSWALFANYMDELNSGTVWADQDLKNRDHYYNPDKKRGLYGFGNALKECMSYYTASLTWWKRGYTDKAIFYLGVSCHLLQDMTVPHHANIRLLNKHRRYEKWVLRVFESCERFKCQSGGIYLNTIKEYIEMNARTSMAAYGMQRHNWNDERKFYEMTYVLLHQAQKSTAGFLNMFYNDIMRLE